MSEGTAAPADPWFESWFGAEYLELYPHRDDEEAERAVALIVRSCGVEPGSAVLDLACGAGRHVEDLRAAGYRAFGLDLSEELLRVARGEAGQPVVRADMRELPVATASVALVTSFFTSFGYFPEAAEDERVLREIRRVLRPGGVYALDFLNAAHVRATLRPHDEVEMGGRRVVQTRSLVARGQVVEKRIEIYDAGRRTPRVFYERVRLYGAGELCEMMLRAGIQPVRLYGDYEGGPHTPAAPRAILIGRAT
jgi:SAM-dependent methyltransferase